MKRWILLCVTVLLTALSLSGCAPELYERILISAIGIDCTNVGYRVTVRAAKAQEDGAETTLIGEGRTVPEALNQLALSTGQEPLYSHNTLVVFGMDCAENGLNGCVDFFIRHYDSRPTIKVFLSETTAEDILGQEGEAGKSAAQLADLSKSAQYSGLSVDANLLDLVHGSLRSGVSASLPVLKAEDGANLNGTALLEDFRLRGVLTPEETRGLLALQGKLKAGESVISDPEGGEISLTVHGTDCVIRFTGTTDAPRFDVSLKVKGDISSMGVQRLTNDAFPRIEHALAQQILEDISAYLSAAVFENGCDAVGFGDVVCRDAPEAWRAMDWQRQISESVFDLRVEAVVARVEEEDAPYL